MDWRRNIRLIGIADPSLGPWPEIVPRVLAATEAGLPAIMLRDRSEAPDEELAPHWERIAECVKRSGAMLIVNRRLGLAKALGADAIHLGARGPALAEARAALPGAKLFGYSAHSLQEAADAFAAGFQYATLSPVFPTPSKPGSNGIGLAVLSEACRATDNPVIALGGIDPANAASVFATGASGIAAIRSPLDPDQLRRLLASLPR